MQRVLTTVTLLGLLVATSAAFAITEHLKLTKSEVFGTKVLDETGRASNVIGPTCGRHCPTRKAILQIKLRHTGRVTVTIVNAAGHEVRTIRSDVLMRAHRPKKFAWDGRTDTGALAPDGVYHPWVALPRKTFPFTNNIILDSKPPEVLSATAEKSVFFAGAGRTVAISYKLSEKAHALVFLGGRQIIKGRRIPKSDKVKWTGRLDGRPLRPGTYVLTIGAQDRAGNVTPASDRLTVTVVVKYIQLTPKRISVRSGRRLAVHVETAARRYTWRLGHRHGARRGKVLRLRAPTTPGTYRLVVAQNGHTSTAVVQVHGK